MPTTGATSEVKCFPLFFSHTQQKLSNSSSRGSAWRSTRGVEGAQWGPRGWRLPPGEPGVHSPCSLGPCHSCPPSSCQTFKILMNPNSHPGITGEDGWGNGQPLTFPCVHPAAVSLLKNNWGGTCPPAPGLSPAPFYSLSQARPLSSALSVLQTHRNPPRFTPAARHDAGQGVGRLTPRCQRPPRHHLHAGGPSEPARLEELEELPGEPSWLENGRC